MAKNGLLEEMLKRINQTEIQMDDVEIRNNKALLEKLMKEFIAEFKKDDPFFVSIYERTFFGGSFYDGLKVGAPNEFDIDLVFKLPVNATPTIRTDNNYPGFVQVELPTLPALSRNPYPPSYTDMQKLMTDTNYLDITKIMKWFQSKVDKAKSALIQRGDLGFIFGKTVVRPLGPAITFTILDSKTGKKFDVDFVPCFKFVLAEWPDNCECRDNLSFDVQDQLTKEFLVVPKQKDRFSNTYLRLSFQGQERRVLHHKGHIKPAIKLLKNYRNKYNDAQISSYYLKTIALWALEDPSFRYFNESLSSIFLQLFKRYHEALGNKKIPYFWNKNFNLFDGCTASHLRDIYNRVGHHLKMIEAIEEKEEAIAKCLSNGGWQVQSRDCTPESLGSSTSDSVDMEKLKQIFRPTMAEDRDVAASFSGLHINRGGGPSMATAQDTGSGVGWGVFAVGAAALAGLAIYGAVRNNRRSEQ